MVTPIDRLTVLRTKDDRFTGIDFVHVVDPLDQTVLHVYFLTDPREVTLPAPFSFDPEVEGALLPQHFVIHNVTDPAAPDVPVVEILAPEGESDPGFGVDTLGRVYLPIRVAEPGTFADYRLRIDDPLPAGTRVDHFFNDVPFSFKAGCPVETECKAPEPACPPEEGVDFPVDYLARDFVSIRNALLDFAAQRYPEWTLPIEADAGVMLAEVMAALGDELSYMQDRFGREAFLETANQRRSLRKKARLFDFEVHDGRSAVTLLELVVDQTATVVRAGVDNGTVDGLPTRVFAGSEDGEPIPFEIGTGIRDDNEYAVRRAWNASDPGIPPELRGNLTPYVFDRSELCLEVGATELYLEGALPDAEFIRDQNPPRAMSLRTQPADTSVRPRRHVVRIVGVDELTDPLTEEPITRIRWHESDALPFQMDLELLQISLNVLPATAGRTVETRFLCGPDSNDTSGLPVAVERGGPLFRGRDDRPTIFLFGLPGTEEEQLAFLGPTLRSSEPEVLVDEVAGEEEDRWTFRRSLLSARSTDEWFTLEDGTWRRIIAYHRDGRDVIHQDYATGAGFSLRFGDGVFGRIPPRGTEFRVRYRLGSGARANVPAGAISLLEVPGVEPNATGVVAVSNPLEVTTGTDPESQRDIKLLVPEAFRADVLFAVRPEDFSRQAEKLSFMQRARGTPRFTGSWTSMFVAGDPLGAFTMTQEQREQLEVWMDCVRQAGRDVIVKDPKTLSLDLAITICVEPFALAAEVRDRVVDLLVGGGGGLGTTPFFHPDNFTFGMPLRRSALEAAIHRVPGVRFVREILVRERGLGAPRPLEELVREVDPDQVIRVDNDPARPESGRLTVLTEGGA